MLQKHDLIDCAFSYVTRYESPVSESGHRKRDRPFARFTPLRFVKASSTLNFGNGKLVKAVTKSIRRKD